MLEDSLPEIIKEWSVSTLNLASSVGNQGRSDKEIEYLLEVAPIAEKYHDYRTSAIIRTNLGITAINEENYAKANTYFEGNDRLYDKANNVNNQYSTDRLMYAYSLTKSDSLALVKNILAKVKSILDKEPESHRWQMYHQIWGDYYVALENYEEALKQYDLSSEIIEKNKLYHMSGQINLNYAEVYELMGNHGKQREYLLKFYRQKRDINKPLEVLALSKLARLEERTGNSAKALEYFNKYLVLNDSVQTEKLTMETNRLERQFQIEKNQRQILELENRNNETALMLERKKSQNYLLYFLLGGTILFLATGYIMYRNRQKKAALKEKIQEQRIQNLKTEQERQLFGVMMEGVEQERKRLAADLHDGLGGRLSGISIKLSKLTERPTGHKIKGHIDDILGNLDDSLQELRGVARNLMPETLLKYGLKAALEDYCSTLKGRDTEITLQYYSTETLTDKSRLLMIYRIIQELINNAVKHSGATEILVQYIHDNDKIDITVEDDGIGFDTDSRSKQNGLGLANLKNRVDFLEAKMDVRSVINEGTSINIQIEAV